MWPASIIVGLPPLFTSAMLLPWTSAVTFANEAAYLRQSFAGAASNPDGPGVSRSDLRKVSESADSPSVRLVVFLAVAIESAAVRVTPRNARVPNIAPAGPVFSVESAYEKNFDPLRGDSGRGRAPCR